MSTMRSALDELKADDLRGSSDEELLEGLGELERTVRILEAERARRIGELERRRTFTDQGSLSLAGVLAERLGISWRVATAQVRLARALAGMPLTREALGEGELSSSAVSLLARARETEPEAFGASEAVLVEAARSLRPRELSTVLASWAQAAAPEAAQERQERAYQDRRLHVSPTLEGMVRLDGDLDPETGQHVLTALRAITDPWSRDRDDPRTPAQRRADALGELARSYLSRIDRPVVGGERPHVSLIVDLQVLRDGAGRSELEDAGPIGPETARRIACDASLSRVITRGPSAVLEVGRRTPVVPAGLRRAVVVRDRGCRFPGCDRPPGWCDAHHVVHWADGGRTDLSNLVLLCRPHHRVVHEGRFGLAMTEGRPVFSTPDGRVLEDRGHEDRGPP